VVLAKDQTWDLFSALDVVDRRSLIRLLERGGLRDLSRADQAPALHTFLTVQRFVRNPHVIEAVSRRLDQ
jgi:hypothetical protein